MSPINHIYPPIPASKNSTNASDTIRDIYQILKGASYANRPGAVFVATNTDEQFPMPGTELIIPGAHF